MPWTQQEPALRTHHRVISFDTEECLQFLDLTDRIGELVEGSGIRHGIVTVQAMHTTGAIVVNEREPLLLEDMRRLLEGLAPREHAYRHDDFSVRTVNLVAGERPNGHSHCKSLFLHTSETLNIDDGRLQLGRWQRIFFLELDGARPRSVSVMVMGSCEPE
jgi:secondary thiamine-phosphate synthase enzyme